MKGKKVDLLKNVVIHEHLQELEKELSIRSKKYMTILNSINEFRYKLTNLRNEKYELEITLNQIEKFKNDKEEEIKFILETNTCPKCHSVLNDTIDLRSKNYNLIENTSHIRDSIYKDIESISKEILQIESSYKECLDKLVSYTNNIYGIKNTH
ncbi:hypothetical protein [Sneathia sanguinegens]|uniref:hypothetical protein n=1 Tax=Sneathia sanguinegens TaxID=40543 RepID=UPI0023F6CC33|nr:hypothetical protein [Sneathia sanguinegens]